MLCIVIVLGMYFTASAQDTAIYRITHSSTGFANRTTDGNSFLVNNNLRFSLTKKRFSTNATNSWIYGAQESRPTNNDFSSAVDFNLFKSVSPFYYWGFVTYDKSYSLKINDRVQAGLGLGYTVANTPSVYVVISDGPLYEYSKLYDTSQYQTVRNSLRLRYRFIIRKMVVLEGTNFYQQSLLSGEDFILKATNTGSLKLNNWLSFTVAVNYNMLNVTKKENLLCNFGFTIDRYF